MPLAAAIWAAGQLPQRMGFRARLIEWVVRVHKDAVTLFEITGGGVSDEKFAADLGRRTALTCGSKGLSLRAGPMHNFDLHWPKTTAFLNTDGQRCRIVWRAVGGIGGTIDNNALCKKRLAEGLSFAPSLLGELRNSGYSILAEEISRLAPPPEGIEERRAVGRPAPPSDAEQLQAWLGTLAGNPSFERCGTRRSKTWRQVAAEGTDGSFDALFLKSPGTRSKGDWVLKRVPNAGGSPVYFSSVSFRGICAYLVATPPYASRRFLDAFVAECAPLMVDHADVRSAIEAWHGRAV